MKVLVLVTMVLASAQIFARSPIFTCKAKAEQMALDEISKLTKEPVELVQGYTTLLESSIYQSTYSVLGVVYKTDYTAILTIENNSCKNLGVYVYQSSFN